MTKEMNKTEEINLEKELEEQKKQTEEYIGHLQRLQAEFQNYQKRNEREQEEFVKFAKKELITELLQVIDNFERALENIDEKSAEGVKLIHKQLCSILEKEGVKEIESLGCGFDPLKHEAIAKEESEKEENEIIEVFEKGYQLHDKVIRPAKVKVSGEKK